MDKRTLHIKLSFYLFLAAMSYSSLVLPSEILVYLKEFPYFDNYTEEELLADLSTLVKSNNLEQIQDKGKAKSYEEYKRNRYRYKLTPHTIELEKALISMETTLHSIRGSLEKSLTDRLLEKLEKLSTQPISKEITKSENQEFIRGASVGTTAEIVPYIKPEK